MNELEKLLEQVLKETGENAAGKLVFSNGKGSEYRRLVLSRKASGNRDFWQLEKYTATQVFHENFEQPELRERLIGCFAMGFRQMDAFLPQEELRLRITKKGEPILTRTKKVVPRKEKVRMEPEHTGQPQQHNREKHYLLREGTVVAPLVDMGIFTAEGKVVRSMYDKFRQINRFLEQVNDVLPESAREISVIDFGCGKSYLTFVLYYFLTELRGMTVRMLGLDLKADVIAHCGETAQKYGYTGLRFEVGDIGGYQTDAPVDLVVTLHACDTATDFALANAVRWNAKVILSVPCCQHELNGQIKSEKLSTFTRFGIIQERTAALMTDAIRAELLTWAGYKTQVLEFVDFAHTPKNLLIRAVRSRLPQSRREGARREAERLMEEFHLSPTIYRELCGGFPSRVESRTDMT